LLQPLWMRRLVPPIGELRAGFNRPTGNLRFKTRELAARA